MNRPPLLAQLNRIKSNIVEISHSTVVTMAKLIINEVKMIARVLILHPKPKIGSKKFLPNENLINMIAMLTRVSDYCKLDLRNGYEK